MDTIDRSQGGSTTALYSPIQLAVAAFLGGPLAAVYFLRANYIALAELQRARMVTLWGGAICVLVLLLMMYLPTELLPQYLIPLLSAGAVYQVADKTMPGKNDIQNDGALRFQSNWRVFWLSILVCVIYFVLLALVALILL